MTTYERVVWTRKDGFRSCEEVSYRTIADAIRAGDTLYSRLDWDGPDWREKAMLTRGVDG